MQAMDHLDEIGERILGYLEQKNRARDRALLLSRTLIRHCSVAIRAVHRQEAEAAHKELQAARALVGELHELLVQYRDLYFAGYTQDALKEFAEANIFRSLVAQEALPDPDSLGIEYAAYLGGLGEAVGELRRRVLDCLRKDDFAEAERLLEIMDDIYGLLVTVDFPDAITGNLRRITDMVRGVTERTRGDLTTSLQQHELKMALRAVERKLGKV
jgi:translin